MGFDKSLVDYHGKPQREYLFDQLKVYCTEVYTSCKKVDDVPASLNPLPDRFEIESPLNGILTAFAAHPLEAWISVPADMPMVDAQVIQHLLAHRNRASMATCYWDSEHKHPEPLLTIWEPHAEPALKIFFEQGKISPREFLNQHPITILEVPNASIHLNINTPEELDAFRRDHPQHP
jgi:molybdopterin-guanine dinucleotide biosynthesis protein A